MWRPNVPLPNFALPEGYIIRELKKGEEEAWCECIGNDMGVHEVSLAAFRKRMGDKTVKPGSILVVADKNGMPVATATAQRKKFGEPWLHMVAVRESERGKKLGKPIVAAVLQRHLDNGKNGCYLVTQEHRVAAVKLYLELGFYPVMNHPSYRERYEQLAFNYNLPQIKCIDEKFHLCEDIKPVDHGLKFF